MNKRPKAPSERGLNGILTWRAFTLCLLPFQWFNGNLAPHSSGGCEGFSPSSRFFIFYHPIKKRSIFIP